MYSFFKKVISTFIPWGSDRPANDLEEEEQRIINSIKSVNTNSEAGNTSQQLLCGQRDTLQHDIETFKCFHKTGKITFLSDEYGIIDNVIYFEPSQISLGLKLELNDEVLYSSYKVKENETCRVLKIYALKNDLWECSEAIGTGLESDNASKVKEICAFSRVITGRVTKKREREIYIESADTWCHLDKIEATYVPVEGDWVELQATVSICEDSADLTGDILEIKSLKPLLTKSGFGRITFWSEAKKEGAIENLIYFTNVICEGYIPDLGDEVIYDAVESSQENFRWRAVRIHFNNLKQGNTDMSDSTKNNSLTKDSNSAFSDKNDISIVPFVCAIEIELNQTKTVVIEVTNHGTTKKYLEHTKFHKRNSQMVLLNPKVSKDIFINPKETIPFEFECKGKNLGLSGEIFYFYFKDFLIAKRFEISVVGNKEMNQLLDCKFGTAYRVFKNRKFFKTDIQANKVFYGPRPWKPPKFITSERKCVFKIPKNLWNIVENSSNELKTLTKYAPYLKMDLNFDQYLNRFHTLLYLEEIELKLNFRKYDMNEVHLLRNKDFFVVEVPGLVEKRPSLIVGDKVELSQPWHDGGEVKHIGYIYFIRGKEIYVKFHGYFHETYNESECNISFEPNTTFFSKCHESVNRAIKLLGKEWLFPSSVKEKPTVLDFDVSDEEVPENVCFLKQIPNNQKEKKLAPLSVDVTQVESAFISKNKKEELNDFIKFPVKKNLVWINKKLNKRQKLAVVNVLRGKGRPLPYIIFGPPGTGKTVTLVEIVIQIYKMMPESRILITTPSNSSADLICERLIECGNFKPGQLIRLVALYRIIEGLVPPKLIPYSTFFTAKQNKSDFPELNPQCKVKGLSQKMAGRHRITIATCATIGILHYCGLPRGHFTHILVDEAGQTAEPEVLISATFQDIKSGQIVLTGDPQQLGPVICSSLAKNFGLGVSLLQRLISTFPYAKDFDSFPDTSGFDPRFVTKLNVNYRNVPEILTLPSQLFYNSDLIPTVSQTEGEEADLIEKFNFEIENRKTPPAFIFHGLIGQNYQEQNCSWFNPQEIWQTVFYMRKLYSIGLKSSDIGIVSPYAKQVQKLKALLLSLDLSLPKIGSVEEFQGQERNVIIVTTVRSSVKYVPSDIKHSLGFVASPQRLNVALTRARALLIIIGNPVLLSEDPYWVSVVNYCVKNNSYIGCSLDYFKENLNVDILKELKKKMVEVDPES